MRGTYGLDDTLDFGKHAGQQLEDVLEDDPGWIEWAVDNEICGFDEEAMEAISKKGIA